MVLQNTSAVAVVRPGTASCSSSSPRERANPVTTVRRRGQPRDHSTAEGRAKRATLPTTSTGSSCQGAMSTRFGPAAGRRVAPKTSASEAASATPPGPHRHGLVARHRPSRSARGSRRGVVSARSPEVRRREEQCTFPSVVVVFRTLGPLRKAARTVGTALARTSIRRLPDLVSDATDRHPGGFHQEVGKMPSGACVIPYAGKRGGLARRGRARLVVTRSVRFGRG